MSQLDASLQAILPEKLKSSATVNLPKTGSLKLCVFGKIVNFRMPYKSTSSNSPSFQRMFNAFPSSISLSVPLFEGNLYVFV